MYHVVAVVGENNIHVSAVAGGINLNSWIMINVDVVHDSRAGYTQMKKPKIITVRQAEKNKIMTRERCNNYKLL